MRTWLAANDDRYSLYDEGGQWLGEYDASGTPVQQIVWLGSLPVGVLTGSGAAQRLHYIEADALGSPRVVVDPTRGAGGTAVWRWALTGETFGNTAPDQDPDGDSVAFVFDMRFTGQRYDAVSGFNYNYFRDYEAATARYSAPDPIGLLGGVSLYGYVGGNPLTRVDPLGLAAGTPTMPWGWSPDWSWLRGLGDRLSGAAAGTASRVATGTGIGLLLYSPELGYSPCEAPGVNFTMCMEQRYPRSPALLIAQPMATDSCPDDEEKKRQNCQALKDSILSTCASLTGRKKFACFAAAEESYRQCMGW